MGLRTTQTLSRINAENVANSSTEGYARRRAMTVTGDAPASGPIVAEIRREVDSVLSRLSRTELGKMAKHQAVFDALNNYTVYLGQTGDGISPAEKYAAFSTSLTILVNTPASAEAQNGVVIAAEDLARSLRGASNTLAGTRADVDMEIRYEVSELNQALYDMASLNGRLVSITRGSSEAAQLGDQMDRLLDKIAGIVDIRTYANSDGSLNIYTSGGAALLERRQVQDVTFNTTTGLLLAGNQNVTPNMAGVRGLTDGSLAGLLEIKREIIPKFQLQLDEYARGLIIAFESSDPSLAPGEPGLFTDAGSSFDALNPENLAFRISVNDAVKPSEGGSVWRVRDGMGSSAPGDASDSSLVRNYIDALQQPFGAIAQTGISSSVKIADYGVQMVSAQFLERARSQENALIARSSAEIVLASRVNFEGVNVDEEMQDLQVIQQSYTANARVLTTVLGMIDTLLNAA